MRGMNTVFLFGNAGAAPEERHTASGRLVAELSLATHRSRKVGDEWVDETDWHRVVLWERLAERAIRDVRKGAPVAVEGSLRTDTWTDADNRRRSRTYVLARRIELGRPPGRPADPAPTPDAPEAAAPASDDPAPEAPVPTEPGDDEVVVPF